MRVTLKEVATLAELSVSTTSRALNGHPAISHETTAKVRRIAGELRYRPVRSHRRAITSASGVLAGRQIAIISLGMDRSLVTMPVISEAFHGAEDGLREAGAKSQIVQMSDLSMLPGELHPEQLSGLILTGAMVNEFALAAETDAIKQLRKLPTVWVIGEPPSAWGDAIVADDFAVGYGAAEQLGRTAIVISRFSILCQAICCLLGAKTGFLRQPDGSAFKFSRFAVRRNLVRNCRCKRRLQDSTSCNR
jgi:DNA-binding LacI/PurR family transcriptional regulator